MSAPYVSETEIANKVAEVVPFARPGVREVDAGELDAILAASSPDDEALRDESEMPAYLHNPPGLVGHITRWMVKTSMYPQPVLALGAALTIVGTAAGRKYAGPTKSGTHLYMLAVAPTGSGKNHAAKMAKRLMREAEMSEMIGPGQFMSEPAVYQTLSKRPQLLCIMDEFGSYLGRINAPKGANGFEKAISGALRIMWGASFDVIAPPVWAASSSRDEVKEIVSPALSIYGMSVHEEFYAALQGADIVNGFLNRFVVFSTKQKPEEVAPQLNESDVPPALVAQLQRVGAFSHNGPRPRVDDRNHKPDVVLDWDCAETRMFHTRLRKDAETWTADPKLTSRVAEIAVRLATIVAIGRSVDAGATISGPKVMLEDIKWGWEVAKWSSDRMVSDARDYMVESDHQGRAMEVLRYIKEAPRRRITATELNRKVKHKFDAPTLKRILDGLRDSDEIDVVRERSEGAKKPTDHIIYTGG